MRRMRILFHGPGMLVGVLILAIAGTAFSRHSAHATHAAHPSPTYSLTVAHGRLAVDPTTGLRAALQRVTASVVQSKSEIRLTLQISLSNSGQRTRVIHRSDFFVVDQSGQSYTPQFLPGSSVRMASRAVRPLPVAISIPNSTHWVEIEWNDGGSLLPPETLAVVTLHRDHSAA